MRTFSSSLREAVITTPANTQTVVAGGQSTGNRRSTKIQTFFENLKWAEGERVNDIEGKRSDPTATRVYIQTRLKLDEKKSELLKAKLAETQDKARIGALEKQVKLLQEQQQKLYAIGPQGLSEEILKEKRKEQRKPAWVEGVHTLLGARLPASASGIAGAEITDPGGKTAIHQSLGYATESILSGLMRIVTEVPQVRMNKGGKPKLPSNLAATSNFKQNNQARKAARENVEAARIAVAAAIPTIPEDGTSPQRENLEALERALKNLQDALQSGGQLADIGKNLWILLEREFRGKKASAVVSVIAGLASTGAFAVEQTGAGAIAAHKILCLLGSLLQLPASYFDYFDGNIDFPQKISSKKIDLALLLKPEALGKNWEDLQDEDIDTTIATKLYDEQPQLVRDTIRNISVHSLAELNAKRLELQAELRHDRHLSMIPSALRPDIATDARRRQKAEQLQKTEREFKELQSQYVAFEQHRHDRLNPDGLIGRAIADPLYFCRKGISANVFNKMGELLSQVNQRVNNYENPLMSVGMASIAMDIATNILGGHFVHDGIHSFDGTGPDNPAAEHATIAIASMSGFAAVNSGVTVGADRFNKTAYDRKVLGSPAYLSNGKGVITRDREGQVQQAFSNGMVSKRKKKKLDKSIAVLAAAESSDATTPPDADVARMQKRWDKFEQRRDKVNETIQEIKFLWTLPQYDAHGRPLLDHKEKPIVIDLRASSACHGHYISVWKRASTLAWGVPKSMYESLRFWKDTVASAKEGKKWRKLAANGEIADPELKTLLDQGEAMLRRYLAPRVDMELGDLTEVGGFLQDVSATIARKSANDIQAMAQPGLWKDSRENLVAHIEHPEFREAVETTYAVLEQAANIDLNGLNEDEAGRLISHLHTLAADIHSMHDTVSHMTADATPGEESSLLTLQRHRRLASLKSNLEQCARHIAVIRSSLENIEEDIRT
jgi:hypothetical protein